jgi:hypothetical protein
MNMDDGAAAPQAKRYVSLKLMAATVGAVLIMVFLGKMHMSTTSVRGVLPSQSQGQGQGQGVDAQQSSATKHTAVPVTNVNVQYIEPMSCAYVSTVGGAVKKARDELWDRWQVGHFPNFLTMMDIPQLSWDLQKAKFITLLLEANSQISRPAGTAGGGFNVSFVVGFSGSSVTAGHDNFYNESYPEVFRRTLAPVFATMGVPLTVRNQALGNNPCFPYDACVKTHLGEDLDVVTWEQSMNCGRSSKPVDTFSRAAHRMRKKPTVVFLTSGGPTWSPEECETASAFSAPDPAAPAALERAVRSSVSQAAQISSFLQDFSFLRDPPDNPPAQNSTSTSDGGTGDTGGTAASSIASVIASATSSASTHTANRDGASLAQRFRSLAPMAQSVFGCADYKCMGPYTPTFNEKTPGGGAAHHPGRGMHQLRGENLAFFFLAVLLEATADVQELLCAKGGVEGAQGAQGASRARLVQVLNVTNAEGGLVGDVAGMGGSSAPNGNGSRNAADVYTFVSGYLSSIQSPPLLPVPASYGLPELAQDPLCLTDFQPRVQHALSDSLVRSQSNWIAELSFLDAKAVLKYEGLGRGYLDRKYIHTSVGVNSTLTLNIRTGSKAPLWLCEVQKGFASYPAQYADLNAVDGAQVFIRLNAGSAATAAATATAAAPVEYSAPDISQMIPLALHRFELQCYRTDLLPPGEHLLTLRQRSDKLINLAYVVAW